MQYTIACLAHILRGAVTIPSTKSLLTLFVVMLLIGLRTSAAQDRTGFLGVAGLVSDQNGRRLNGVQVIITNTYTNQRVETSTPSTLNATAGFFFVTFSDFFLNSAAGIGDVLQVVVRHNGSDIESAPASYVITSGDIRESLAKVYITALVDVAIDRTPPEPEISYGNGDGWSLKPGRHADFLLTFSEPVTLNSSSAVTIVGNGLNVPVAISHTSSRSEFALDLTLPDTEAVYAIRVTGFTDWSGLTNRPLRRQAFRVTSRKRIRAELALSSASAQAGSDVRIDVLLAGPLAGPCDVGNLNVHYPAERLRFLRAVPSEGLSATNVSVQARELSTGSIHVLFLAQGPSSFEGGPIVGLEFHVAETNHHAIPLSASDAIIGLSTVDDPIVARASDGAIYSGFLRSSRSADFQMRAGINFVTWSAGTTPTLSTVKDLMDRVDGQTISWIENSTDGTRCFRSFTEGIGMLPEPLTQGVAYVVTSPQNRETTFRVLANENATGRFVLDLSAGLNLISVPRTLADTHTTNDVLTLADAEYAVIQNDTPSIQDQALVLCLPNSNAYPLPRSGAVMLYVTSPRAIDLRMLPSQ